MKTVLLVLTSVTLLGTAQAKIDQRSYEVGSIKTVEVLPERTPDSGRSTNNRGSYRSSRSPFINAWNENGGGGETSGSTSGSGGGVDGGSNEGGDTSGSGYGDKPDHIEQAGRIIQAGRDVVALGDAIYELLKKNAPVIRTDYAPISVVPRDPNDKSNAVDIWDMEGFSMPVEKRYQTRITDKVGKEAVIFDYKLMYSYGGSYNGKGKFLTGITIVPGNIVAKRGWTVDSSMKLSGIMNHGTKDDPIAGAIITIKYNISSLGRATERNDTIHIMGNGKMQAYLK
jgi:hypothetical protein